MLVSCFSLFPKQPGQDDHVCQAPKITKYYKVVCLTCPLYLSSQSKYECLYGTFDVMTFGYETLENQ